MPAQAPAGKIEAPQPPAAATQARLAESRANLEAITQAAAMSNAELNKDPEYRKAQLAQRRIELAQTYPGLKEALGLSDKEADRIFQAIAENTMSTADQIASLSKPGEMIENMRRQTEKQNEAIHALLGDAKFAEFNEYQQTRPARNQARTFGNTLTAAGTPMTDSQSRALTNALIAEQQRQRQQPPIPRPPADPSNPQSQTAQLMAAAQERQAENNRRVLEAASSALSATQIETLRQQFEREDAARRSILSRVQIRPQVIELPAK
jgi:hypothetical protein